MVEGGTHMHTEFLSAGPTDELHLGSPMVVGHAESARFLLPANYTGGSTRCMHLAEARAIGDVVPLRYLPELDSAS